MKPSSLLKASGMLAAFSLAATLFAGAPPYRAGSSTVADTATSLSQKASGLLAEVHQDAQGVLDSADTLEQYNREAFLISWQADAFTLDTMHDQINDLDRSVEQLRVMEQNLPPAQQTEINQIAPAAVELTNTTQAAIDYLKDNQNRIMFPPYTSYAAEMHDQAARIVRSSAHCGCEALNGAQ